MITIRQNCGRCEAPILHDHVNRYSGIYNCKECDVVGSIFDEKEYKAPKNISAPASTNTKYQSNKMIIDIKGHRSVPVRGPLAYVLIGLMILLAVGGISRCLHFDASTEPLVSIPIMAMLFIIFIILMLYGQYKMKTRIIRIEVGPKTLLIFQINNGKLAEKNELELDSFMISQIYVKEEERSDRNNKGVKRKTDKIYILKALLKDMTEKTMLPEMLTKETYMYLEYAIEDFLGIKNRTISSESDL